MALPGFSWYAHWDVKGLARCPACLNVIMCWEQNSPTRRMRNFKTANSRKGPRRTTTTTTEEIKMEDKTRSNRTLQIKFFVVVFLFVCLFLKPQYYSPLYDAHGVGRVNTTSFTFESSVSSQGPLPKEDPVGACGGGVGVRKGGMHWARGAETFAHRPPQRQTGSSRRRALWCFISLYV